MKSIARNVTSTVALLALLAATADAQVLTLEEVRAMDWSGAIPVKLKAATDGVFDEGPDYWYDCEDEWFCESDVIIDRYDFPIAIYNNGQHPLDDLVFLLAYKDGDFSSIDVGNWVVTREDFYDNNGEPFGPAGNRPGDGESALYNGAEGVVFVRIGTGVARKDTVEIPIEVHPLRMIGGLTIHFDFYGVTFRHDAVSTVALDRERKDSAPGDASKMCRSEFVACTNAASHDITWDSPCYPSATIEETWGRVKTFLDRRGRE